MTSAASTTSLDLLRGAVVHADDALAALAAAVAAAPERLGWPTPCAGWRLVDLLAHLDDGVAAFTEAAQGRVRLYAEPPDPAGPIDRITGLRAAVRRLVEAWDTPADATPAAPSVGVADRRLPATGLVRVAALEVVVHAWDVDRALGRHHPVPSALVRGLWRTAQRVAPADRRAFAAPITAPAGAAPGDRLAAYLGRPVPPAHTAGWHGSPPVRYSSP